jgi:hypothetical protein
MTAMTDGPELPEDPEPVDPLRVSTTNVTERLPRMVRGISRRKRLTARGIETGQFTMHRSDEGTSEVLALTPVLGVQLSNLLPVYHLRWQLRRLSRLRINAGPLVP